MIAALVGCVVRVQLLLLSPLLALPLLWLDYDYDYDHGHVCLNPKP